MKCLQELINTVNLIAFGSTLSLAIEWVAFLSIGSLAVQHRKKEYVLIFAAPNLPVFSSGEVGWER